jgi:cytochrome P450
MKAMLGCGLLFLALLRLVDVKSALVASILSYAAFILFRLSQLYRNQQLVKHIPGKSYLLTPWASLLAFFLPPIKYISAPLNDPYNDPLSRRKRYEMHDSTITSFIGALPPRISLHVADATAIKAITSDRKVYPKPLELYRILAVYGENVVITEGDEWRKHRRIVGSSFNETNNKLDWEQSTLVTRHWMESLDKSRKERGQTICEDVAHLCLHLTLSVSFLSFYPCKSS